MEFRLLGPVEVLRDGRPVALGGAKPRALLALLLLHANEVVSRDRLIDALWGDRPPGTAGHSLDVQISRLRKAFEPDELLLTQSGGYVLQVEPEQIDVHRFERLLEEGRRANAAGKPAEALEALEAALGLWRGAALADLSYETFARSEIERLEELRLVATEERIDAELALGRHDTLIPELEALTARHPLRERVRGQLMLALYRAGRQAEALRVYSDARKRLVEELGIEPGSALKELEQAILRQDPALDLPRPVAETRRRRALAGAGALLLAGAAVAVVVGLTQGGTESAQALAEPDSNVFVSAATGELVRASPVRDTVRVAYGEGALWSVSSRGDLTRLDPSTSKEVATLGLGIKPSGLAVGEGSVWVTDRNSPTLLRIDPSRERGRRTLPTPDEGARAPTAPERSPSAPAPCGSGTGRFNPGAFVERLDAETGRLQHRFSILGGDVDHLAFADGALWVASTPSGELRKIDPRTNDVVFMRPLQAELCCVAAGGGYVWAASNPEGEGLEGRNERERPRDDQAPVGGQEPHLRRRRALGRARRGRHGGADRPDHRRDPRVRPRPLRVERRRARRALRGGRATQHRGRDGRPLGGRRVGRAQGERALRQRGAHRSRVQFPTWDAPQEMFHYTTCARLLNYPDEEGEAGRRLVPEVAEGLPEVSDGRRTFTFRIRKGFGFSPPSKRGGHGRVVPARRRARRRACEAPRGRASSPSDQHRRCAGVLRGQDAPHLRRLSSRGRARLSVPRARSPTFRGSSRAVSCAVPVDTPVVEGGLETPVPSAGPYYLSALTDSLAVLKPNPNYGGSRPQHLDAIVVEFNVPPAEAATRIENGTPRLLLRVPAGDAHPGHRGCAGWPAIGIA